jgi:molecular chaperone Hsp33
MSDLLYRFTFEHFGVRGEIVALGASWRVLVERHDYAPAVRDYLGQAMAAATMLSGTIKFKGSLILQLQGDGPLRTLVAQATDRRTIRGMALAPAADVPAGRLASAFGDGRLMLTAESPKGERYQGIVALQGDSLAEVLETYFAQSEQLATRLWLVAGGQAAAGLFLQRLPGEHVDDEDWRRVCLLADTLEADELLRQPPREILRRLYHEEDVRLYEPEPVAFRCSCSRERIETALRIMGRGEVESIIEEQGAVDADCEFCNAHYHFDAVDVAGLFAEGVSVATSGLQH